MSTKLNVETFIAVLRKSALIDRDRLEDALAKYSAANVESDDPVPLVDHLIAANLLTRWQAEKLLQGKHRGYFLGKYKLLSLLGKGGMSSVYLAEHLLMRRRCALKVLPAKRVDDSSYLERFHREAQAVALLDHPNIVRAYDVDHQNDGDRQIHFLVMEHVDGRSLQEMVAEKGLFSFLDAAEVTRQSASGLQDAHEHGMVHRDIKPGNLLVDQNGVVKILDLGLARFFSADEGNDALTIRHDEKVLGTADYLAPEQAIDSHTVDARADIYSLGCTLYFMLTGQPPFTEGTLAQRLMAHQIKTPTPVESIRTDTPLTLVAILRKMMEKKADDRFANAAELEKVLFNWIDENADSGWRSSHSGVYGSRVSSSDSTRKAIPVAQPVVATVVRPVNSERPQSPGPQATKPNSSKSNLPKIASPPSAETQDTAMNQFFSTLTQPTPVAKAPSKSGIKAQPNTEPKSVKSASNPSIVVPPKSSPHQVAIDLSAAIAKPAPTNAPPSPFPVFDPYEFGKSTTGSALEDSQPISSVSVKPRKKSFDAWKTGLALWQTALMTWNKLSLPVRGGIGAAIVLVVIFALYMFGGFGGLGNSASNSAATKPNLTPFPRDKREVTVGGKDSEYQSIREALTAVLNRYRPGSSDADRFVVRISAGTYDERIRIDGKAKHWPEGITVQGEGEVIIQASGDEPVIRLSNIARLTVENIQIDANNKPVAIEASDDLHESRLNKLTVRGFTDAGVLCRGAQGLSFGSNQFFLEQLTFEPAGPQACGIRLAEGPDNDVNSIVIRGCRFLNPMSAGVVIQGRAPYGVDISECIFNKSTDGIRIDGQSILKGIRVANNSFRQTKTGIRFSKMPSDISAHLAFRRNLFVNTELAEAIVQDGYDEAKFRSLLSTSPPGVENNWSDRAKSAAPNKGEIQLFFENGGRQGEQGFAFASTDPNAPKFLAPTEKSPQRDVAGAQPTDKKWVGAVSP